MNVERCSIVAASLATAAILIYSATGHLLNFNRFLISIFHYRILPSELTTGVAIVMIAFMLASGVGLLVRETRVIGSTIGFLIFAVFGLAVIAALVRGIDISCGCMIGDRKVDWIAAAKPLLLALICFMLARSVHALSK